MHTYTSHDKMRTRYMYVATKREREREPGEREREREYVSATPINSCYIARASAQKKRKGKSHHA